MTTSEDRQTCFFTAVDPSRKPDVNPWYESGQSRMVPCRMTWKRHHDSVYWFDLKIAQDKGLVFWLAMSHDIILNDSMPVDCSTKVVRYNHEILYHKSQSGPQVAPKSHPDPLSPKISQPFLLTPLHQVCLRQEVEPKVHGKISNWARET